jgi:hypothetical protein
LKARGVELLHYLSFQRALRFSCLSRPRIAWTGRLLQRAICIGCEAFAWLFVLCFWLVACVFLLRLGSWRLLNQRSIWSVRLRVSLLRSLRTLVLRLESVSLLLLILCLPSLSFLGFNLPGFLSLAVLLLPLLVVPSLALLRLTLLDIPSLTLLQLALLAGLRLALL